MKVKYDPRTDSLSIILLDRTVFESDEEKPGMILDYDQEGNLVALEILDASKKGSEPGNIKFQVLATV